MECGATDLEIGVAEYALGYRRSLVHGFGGARAINQMNS